MVTLASREDLVKMVNKFVRGATYQLDRAYIELPKQISVFIDDDEVEPMTKLMVGHEQVYSLGPGVTLRRLVVEDREYAAIYAIDLWGRFKPAAAVTEDDDESLDG